MNPRFPCFSQDARWVASGSGQIWLRDIFNAVDKRIDQYGGWQPHWLDHDRVLYNGGNINDQPGHPERVGTWQYQVSTGARTRLTERAYSEASAGGGHWLSVGNGLWIRLPDGTIRQGRYFSPSMNTKSVFGFCLQGADERMTLTWNEVPIRVGSVRTPFACAHGIAWVEGYATFGKFGPSVERLDIPIAGVRYHRCVPISVGTEVWLLQSRTWPHFDNNEDELILHPKGSTQGYFVLPHPQGAYESTAMALTNTKIRVAYAANGLQVATIDLTKPRRNMAETQDPIEPPVEPPIEPPVEPPIEPPVEPPIEPPVEPPVDPNAPDPADPRHLEMQDRTRRFFAHYKDLYGADPEPFSYADFMTDSDGFHLADDYDTARGQLPHMWWRHDACQSLSDVYLEKAGLNRPWDADGAAWYHFLQVYHGWTKEMIRADQRDSEEWQEEHPGAGPSPGPEPPERPEGGILPVPAVHRSDFLTLMLLNGKPDAVNIDTNQARYQLRSPERRKETRDAIKARGYTRLWIDVCKDNADEFATPETLVPILREVHEDGIGVCLLIAPEDAPKMEAKYIKTGKYNAALEKALKVWKPWVTEVCIGVEASETWKKPADILTVAKTVRKVIAKPKVLSLHLNSGDRYPENAGSGFWAQAKSAGITVFDYQAEHPAVEDGGGAFLADPNTVKTQLKDAVAATGGAVKVRLHEYAYFGKNPSKAIIQKVSKEGSVLGEKGLEVAGVTGICNGGPGYWPPEKPKPVPPGTEDDIDVNLVRFFTRTGSDISKEIRKWPVDSVLTPKFEGDDYVYYAHSQSRSWPDTDGNVNANSWVVFKQDGEWKAYTNDYLRPGEPKKDWQKVNQINEPKTGWEARKGETIYLLASRIARTGSYPNGKSRTQLVKVKCP